MDNLCAVNQAGTADKKTERFQPGGLKFIVQNQPQNVNDLAVTAKGKGRNFRLKQRNTTWKRKEIWGRG